MLFLHVNIQGRTIQFLLTKALIVEIVWITSSRPTNRNIFLSLNIVGGILWEVSMDSRLWVYVFRIHMTTATITTHSTMVHCKVWKSVNPYGIIIIIEYMYVLQCFYFQYFQYNTIGIYYISHL